MQQSVSIQLKVAHGVRIKEVLKMLRQQGQQLTKHSSDREKQLVFNSLVNIGKTVKLHRDIPKYGLVVEYDSLTKLITSETPHYGYRVTETTCCVNWRYVIVIS